jgi:hypothetical protein
MKRQGLALPLAMLFTAFLVSADVYAQSGGLGGIFGGNRGGRSRGGDSQGSSRDSSNERTVAAPEANSYEVIEYRLSLLQEDLKLNVEQSGPWQTFATKARAYAGDLARERARSMRPPYASTAATNGLQHIGETVDAAQNRLTALQEVESSAKALYQTLTPEQKTLADMRIPTIIGPRPSGTAGSGAGSNLPDLGSSSRQSR